MRIFVIRDECGSPYLIRLTMFSFFGWELKLHIFLRSDADEELHDHPWNFWSWVLIGEYAEITPIGYTIRKRWSFAYRRAEWRHRVICEKPVVTLVLTAPKSREWGFWRRSKFIPWREFVDSKRCQE